MSTKTPFELAMLAADAAQSEATASKAVADSVKAQALANPNDEELQASAIAKQAEAEKDQKVADELMAKAEQLMDAETNTTPTTNTMTDSTETNATTDSSVPTTPVADSSTPVTQNTEAAPEVVNAGTEDTTAEMEPIVPQVTQVVSTPKVISQPAAPVQTVVAAVVTDTSKPVAADGSFEAMVADLKVTGTVAVRTLINQLEQYAANMKPGIPMDAAVGARHQVSLWRAIQNVIERSGDEFKKCYSLLLAFFEEYKDGVFHEKYVFRFTDNVTLSGDELAAFQRVLNLLKLTSAPKSREQSLKQVDLGRTLSVGVTEQGRQRILGFYNR